MNKLWAPWRMDYIRTPKEGGCVFCDKSQTTQYKRILSCTMARKVLYS